MSQFVKKGAMGVTKSHSNKPVVIFANTHSAVAATRSLQKHGLPYFIVLDNPAKYEKLFWKVSPYRENLLNVSSDSASPESFMESVREIREQIGEFIVFPANSSRISVLMDNEEELRDLGIDLPLPPRKRWIELEHKERFLRHALDYGLGIPSQIDPEVSEPPIVAKPKVDILSDGTRYRTQLIRNQRELDDFFDSHPVDDFIFQEYVEGPVKMFNSIWDNGDLIDSFGRRATVRQPNGTSGNIRILPADTPDSLEEKLVSMISDLDWTGPVQVQYVDGDDQPVMMEANARFWMRLDFAITNGYHFPVAMYDICNDTSYYESPSNDHMRGYQSVIGVLQGMMQMAVMKRGFLIDNSGSEYENAYGNVTGFTDQLVRPDTFYNIFILDLINKILVPPIQKVLPGFIEDNIRRWVRE